MKKIVLFLMAICTATVLINAQTSGPVDFYGELQVSGNRLVGSKTNETPVQIKRVSLGWSNLGWESSHYFNANAVNAMVDLWKAEIIRVPIGYSEGGGYKSDASNKTRVKAAVDAAIAKGVYVIIDWHSHSAHNEEEAAKQYFAEMAEEYGENDHVIFEIYNEPLKETSWSVIKTYANTIITEIRKHSDNLILVGTRSWSQLVSEPKNNKIDDANTAYVLHFYANQHTLDSYTAEGATFRNETISALDNDLAVFVSEYGTVDANGNGDHSDEESNKWHAFLDTHKISSCAWQLSYKNEGSAFFTKNFDQSVSENFIKPENLKATGLYLYDKLSEWAEVAPWRNSKPCTNAHKITYLTGNDATTIAEGSVCDGEVAVKPKKDPVRAGYEFIGWYSDNTTFTNQYFGNEIVQQDITLYAKWKHTHDFSKENTDVAPTCSSKGEGHYSCPICGAIGDSYEIAELEHNYIWIVDPNNADREIEVCADCREESGNTREREETGVEELHEKTIFAYPNPTTGVVYLSEQSNVQLFSNLGQLLFKGNVQSLDISGFERGVYVLRVGETSIQIIKE